MVFSNNLLLGAAGADAGYTIDQSIRFNDNDSAYLTRTPGSAGNRKKFTLSWWWKPSLSDVSANDRLFEAYSGANDFFAVTIMRDDATYSNELYFQSQVSNVNVINKMTAQVFRDPSAWYHCVIVIDTDNATAEDRNQLYVNGVRVTSWFSGINTNSSSGHTTYWNNTNVHYIGRASGGSYFDGYMAEIYNIDGQALDPTSFGEVDSTTGQWVPIAYNGSYGTNGFYITGEDSADLGADYSGNGNDFTSSGLTSADQRTDTPTNNHCTFNPLWIDTYTLSDGNLVTSTGPDASALGTMAVDATDSDGWYWEMKVTTAATYPGVGIILASQTSLVANTALSGTNTNRYYYESWSGNFNNQGSVGAYGNTWSGTANKVIGVYLKGGALWFSIDGVVQNSGDPSTASTGAAITGLTGDFYPVVVYSAGSGTQAAWTAQFAEADWGTTPPAGYKAINTTNLSDPTIADPTKNFNTVLWTGDGASSRTISGVGFNPDLVWAKSRSAATTHKIMDDVRGANLQLSSDQTAAEINVTTDTSGGGLGTTTADGFTLVSGTSNANNVNASGTTFVAWNWKANGSGSSNTDGSITSTVSVNTTAGFSVISYTGNGAAGATVGHGLGVKPSLLICKNRQGTEQWITYDKINGATKYMLLNSNTLPATSSGAWNNTEPTSSVVTLGGGGFGTNVSSNNMIMYAFAEVEGFSKVGSYVANASTDGPFIYCGFRPAWIIFFIIAGTGAGRSMLDSVRDPYNPEDSIVQANTTAAESSGSSYYTDFLSNGFKLRTSSDFNGSGRTVLYMAFAESPFKTANAR